MNRGFRPISTKELSRYRCTRLLTVLTLRQSRIRESVVVMRLLIVSSSGRLESAGLRIASSLEGIARALDDGPWAAVIAEPRFGEHEAADALRLVRERDGALPFLVLSELTNASDLLALQNRLHDRSDAEAVLARSARRQHAIARFGREVLSSVGEGAFRRACELAGEVTEAEFAFFAEMTVANDLRLREGTIWTDDGRHVPALVTAQAAAALIAEIPATVHDYRSDTRFTGAADVASRGIVSGVVVAVAGRERPFGVLAAFARRAGHFGDDDVHFLETLATMLADALEREQAARSLERMLESTIDGIFTVDLEGRCTMINRAGAALIGMSVGELIGRPIHEIVHREGHGCTRASDQCSIHTVVRTGQAQTIAGDSFVRGDGSLVPVNYSAAPILDDGVLVGGVVTFTDLTERRKLETKLEQATRVSSLGRLAATVAHEFNNVLMGIAPFVDVIRRSSSPQKVQAALDHIGNSIKRGQRITGDILRFAQPAEPARTRIDVARWLEALAAEAHSILDRRHTIRVTAEPLAIEGDSGQLHQVMMNLIFNARDAMPSGGTIDIAARRTQTDGGAAVHISVRDTGIGMPEEILDRIFEPLFTTKKNGTGLGLPVAHQVVQRHGGDISAESEPALGTTFHIVLPLASPDETAPDPEEVERPRQTKPQRILLVEDDPIVAEGLRELLEVEGFRVTAVDTGRAAVRTIAAGPLPDAVILDVGLPDMDGTAAFHEIAEIAPALPVVFSTGHGDRARLEDVLQRHNVAYLLKPYESESLLAALSEVTSRP
jgi:PAS domain S-box-containing protein